jgi:two-component system, chemotaxis family, sensor kinase CheA
MLPDIIEEFLIESHEGVGRLDRDLGEFETDPPDRERLSSVIRSIHTIKGSCGLLGFSTLQAIRHIDENLLYPLRDGELALNVTLTTCTLSVHVRLRSAVAQVGAATLGVVQDDASSVVWGMPGLVARAGEPAPTRMA